MTAVVEWHQPPAPLVKTLNAVLRAVLPSPLGRGVGEFMLLAFAARMIGLKFPLGRLPTLDEVVELAGREHFGVVRLSVRT
ncbi:hypothetical protein AB0L41_31510 [Amycolatopsis mediterranei]|uniref:hypothetical protein n=1 Tax=Amycolatopsis mediterranei TaxID=33910 RepID=UPI003414313D